MVLRCSPETALAGDSGSLYEMRVRNTPVPPAYLDSVLSLRRSSPTTPIFKWWFHCGGARALCRKVTIVRNGDKARLHGEDFDCLLEAGRRVASLGGGVFVAHVPGEIHVGNGLGDEPVVQFLGLVDFLAPRIAAGVEVPDPLYVVADVAHDIAIHDLGVIDIVENLDARRIDALHDVHAPGDVVEHVIFVVDLAVEILHADSDALNLGVGLYFIEEGHAVGGAFGIGHAFAVAAEGDDVGHSVGRGFIDGGMH